MAAITGNNGVLKIDNASGQATAIANVRNYSIDITSDTIETTTMGVDVRTYVKGLSQFSGSADIYFDTANYTGGGNVVAVLNPTSVNVGAIPVTLEAYLNDTANKFAGEVIITGFTVNSSMDGLVEASISFQGSGPITFTA
jgi:predicted secreted protein